MGTQWLRIFWGGCIAVGFAIVAGYFAPHVYGQSAESYIYSSPRPDAELVSAQTTIAVRYRVTVNPQSLKDGLFNVVGSESGQHTGDLILANDQRTILFRPQRSFVPKEAVHVEVLDGIRSHMGQPLLGGNFSFTISPKDIVSSAQFDPHSWLDLANTSLSSPGEDPFLAHNNSYYTIPDGFPAITVTVPASNTADGYIFLSNFDVNWGNAGAGAGAVPYLMILDNSGEPVYYKQIPSRRPALDFKKQPTGHLTYGEWGGVFTVMNSSYEVVDKIQAGNGYHIDIHDLQLLPNGHALLMIYDPQPVDMSQIVEGGHPNATVVGLVIQELDSAKNVILEWRSWDYISITDSVISLTGMRVDYVHGNSVELDTDGNLLISSRYLDEVTKIDRETGHVIWRLGGKKNEFTFLDGSVPFFDQHDARRLKNGHVTIFDNRSRSGSTYSRVVEYSLDEVNKVADQVWEYRSPTGSVSGAMGNAQRLPNGNTFIGWGTLYPTLTEVLPNNTKAFELSFVAPNLPQTIRNSYRAFRFPWAGSPTQPPTLANNEDWTRLYYSWNGATDVFAYELYGGNAVESLQLIDIQLRQGFETLSDISDQIDDYCFFRVRAVRNDGSRSPISNTLMAERCITSRLHLPLVYQ
jgi:hypothetical protein